MKQLFALDKHILWFGSVDSIQTKKRKAVTSSCSGNPLKLFRFLWFAHCCKALGSEAPSR